MSENIEERTTATQAAEAAAVQTRQELAEQNAAGRAADRQHAADREAAIEALVAARRANAADLPASLKA